jgi:hypothetical protein
MNQGWRILSGRATGSSESRLDSPRVVFSGPIDPAGPPPPFPSPDPEHAPFAFEVGSAPGLEPSAPIVPSRPLSFGLLIWLGIFVVFGVGGLLLGMQEMALLVAFGGLFVASHAADVDPLWTTPFLFISWTVSLFTAIALLVISILIVQGGLTVAHPRLVSDLFLLCAAASILVMFRPIANPLARLLFRVPEPSHTLRQGMRIVLIACLVAVPAWYALRPMIMQLLRDPTPLLEKISLESELVGYILLALAGVGFMIRRDVPRTLERLGLRSIPPEHLAVAVIGLVALFAFNTGADWLQQIWLPDLWRSDHEVNQSLASGLGMGRVLLLGASAGIGEEITLRGALQPKLGLVMTSLLFASLHIQYSWYGIAVIFLLGMLLGTIRSRASTSAAMLVHGTYDVLAVLTSK